MSENEKIIDEVDLHKILASGPSVPKSSLDSGPPPMPSEVNEEDDLMKDIERDKAQQESKKEVAEKDLEKKREESLQLPNPQLRADLKAKFGALRVVPIPFSEDAKGRMKVYLLRSMTRSNWRALIEQAKKVAESKPDASVDEIFKEKVVAYAAVWPSLPEHTISQTPPGLVDTLFEVVRQMGLFADPEVVMAYSYML